ncbi:uncharacterized protein LOC108088711 [Drosophila ficusphila]|uniref:uncharacterized protein LOC108088711 n=1 Tax=Drosophila ficusphila TaxID=30025 RepID=UPI0007E5D007|nr:uncharacterized protein LOC108088711 [Drosophila ficusphila]
MSPAEQLRLVGGSDGYQLAASTGGGGGGGGGAGGGGGVAGGRTGGEGGADGEKLKDMNDKYVIAIAHFLDWHVNETVDLEWLSGPTLKSSIKSVYWLFLIQYATLALLGVVLNVVIAVYIMYHRLYKDVTHAFIINLALCHFVQCALVLPVSLMVMLIQNWIFGQFLCFFLPMLQDIPLHVAMISHILIAWDRMRWLNDPLKGRLPGFVCCCATWLTGMVIALPYPIYTIYVDMGDYMPQLSGIGLCVVNLMDDMQEYTRGLFLLMYCGPAILLSYLYIRTSQELRPPDGPFAVMMYEHRADVRMRQRNSSTSSVEPRTLSGGGVAGLSNGGGNSARSYDLYSAELDVHREKRKQRNFGSMAATQVVCMCPLMILRFARLSLEETYENTKHFDFTYLMFVWMAFLPTVIFPCIYASQILPREERERLRGYFRLSSKRKSKSQRRSDAGGGSGGGGSSREDSIEKDEASNATSGHQPADSHKQASKLRGHEREVRLPSHGSSSGGDRYTGAPYRQGKDRSGERERDRERERQRAGGRGAGDAGVVNNLGKDVRGKKHDVKINIISDGVGHAATGHAHRKQPGGGGGGGGSSSNNSNRSRTNPSQRQGKLSAADCLSNVTASTFCNGSGSLNATGLGNGSGNGNGVLIPDDSGTSNYGDGEESSVVSSMMVPAAQRWPGSGSVSIRHKDVSFSECSSSTFSSSTLDRDLEIMDQLERERSMDIQEMLQRERERERERDKGRRQLPDIEKLYAQRSPKGKRGGDGGTLALVLPGSDPLSSLSQSQSLSTEYSLCSSTLESVGERIPPQDETLPPQHLDEVREEEEVVPPDFYDSYTPGGSQNLPPGSMPPNGATAAAAAASVVPAYQYQYSRNRLSRKSSGSGSGHHHHQHHHQHHHAGGHHGGQHGGGGVAGGRNSKRDSFNSLNGTDLIAGAFCELDPTQPLNKMAVIEGRMRRSSPRNASFSSGSGVSGRSSMKSSSRDYDYGHGSSSHSAHPELDFRENIFAEL